MKLSLNESIRSIPSLRIVVILALGIMTGNSFELSAAFLVAPCILVITSLFISSNASGFSAFNFQWIRGILLLFCVFLAGINMGNTKEEAAPSNITGIFVAECIEYPEEKEKSILLTTSIRECYDSSQSYVRNRKVLIYTEKSDSMIHPAPGDRIIFRATLEVPSNSGNPDEFDYAAYLKSSGISYQCYIRQGEWEIVTGSSSRWRYLPLEIREYFKGTILNSKGSDNAKAVMIAVTVGDKSLLDRSLKQSYSDAGAIHVMAVSGLHVGMIWLFISWFLKIIPGNRARIIAGFPVILSILWIYALVTGLSPSVVRSCLMFSMVSLGKVLNRNSGVVNTLSLSALIQLIINPQVVFNVGFQFSYTAVLGIVLFQPLLKNMYSERNKIIKWFLDLASVSLSAQTFTWLLAVHYFHRFPALFLLTNIFVIPLVTGIMMLFLLSVATFFQPALSSFLLDTALWLTHLMNFLTESVGGSRFSVLTDLNLSLPQTFLMLLFPLAILSFLSYGKAVSVSLAGLILGLFLVSGIMTYRADSAPESLIVWNVRDADVVSVASKGKWKIVSNLEPEELKTRFEYASENYRIRHFLDPPQYINPGDSLSAVRMEEGFYSFPGKGNKIVLFHGEKLLLLRDFKSFRRSSTNLQIALDKIILCGKEMPQPAELLKFFSFRELVISASVPPWLNVSGLKPVEGIGIHDVREKGAYIWDISTKLKK